MHNMPNLRNYNDRMSKLQDFFKTFLKNILSSSILNNALKAYLWSARGVTTYEHRDNTIISKGESTYEQKLSSRDHCYSDQTRHP